MNSEGVADYIRRYSLATQIRLAWYITITLLLLLLLVVILVAIYPMLRQQALEVQPRNAEHHAEHLDDFIAHQRDKMLLEATYQLSPAGETLEQTLSENTPDLEIAIFDMRGRPVFLQADSLDFLVASPLEVRRSEWFTYTASGQLYVSFREQDNQRLLLLSHALQDYVVVSLVGQNALNEAMAVSWLDEEEHIYVFQTRTTQRIWDSMAMEGSIPLALYSITTPFATAYTNSQGERVLGAGVPVGSTNLILVDEIPEDAALSGTYHLIAIIISMLLVAAVLALVGGWYAARQIAKPFKELINWVTQLETQSDEFLALDGHSEATILALGLAHLTEEIAHQEKQLRSANATLTASNQELSVLSRQVIAIAEEERRRVSRELHDGFGQMLVALKMSLDIARRTRSSEKKNGLLDDSSRMAEQIMEEVHIISQGLRPTILDDLGLQEALEWYIRLVEEKFGMVIDYQLSGVEDLKLSSECEITAFRFLQEALTNVYKHARDATVSVRLRQQANYTMLAVKDDGFGFDPKSLSRDDGRLSLGLVGLQERLALAGGELVIHSEPGKGTTLIALLPSPAHEG